MGGECRVARALAAARRAAAALCGAAARPAPAAAGLEGGGLHCLAIAPPAAGGAPADRLAPDGARLLVPRAASRSALRLVRALIRDWAPPYQLIGIVKRVSDLAPPPAAAAAAAAGGKADDRGVADTLIVKSLSDWLAERCAALDRAAARPPFARASSSTAAAVAARAVADDDDEDDGSVGASDNEKRRAFEELTSVDEVGWIGAVDLTMALNALTGSSTVPLYPTLLASLKAKKVRHPMVGLIYSHAMKAWGAFSGASGPPTAETKTVFDALLELAQGGGDGGEPPASELGGEASAPPRPPDNGGMVSSCALYSLYQRLGLPAEGKLPAKTEAFFKRGERWFASNKAMRQSDPAAAATPSLVALAFSGRSWEMRRIGALSHVASTPFAAAAIEKLSLGGRAPLLGGWTAVGASAPLPLGMLIHLSHQCRHRIFVHLQASILASGGKEDDGSAQVAAASAKAEASRELPSHGYLETYVRLLMLTPNSFFSRDFVDALRPNAQSSEARRVMLFDLVTHRLFWLMRRFTAEKGVPKGSDQAALMLINTASTLATTRNGQVCSAAVGLILQFASTATTISELDHIRNALTVLLKPLITPQQTSAGAVTQRPRKEVDPSAFEGVPYVVARALLVAVARLEALFPHGCAEADDLDARSVRARELAAKVEGSASLPPRRPRR